MKRKQKNKKINNKQASFYFEDYLETNQKNKRFKNSSIYQDRIYILFFIFLCLVMIFAIKIIFVSLKQPIFLSTNNSSSFTVLRRDIVDRNGILISRNINSYHAAINPKLVKNKENFFIKIRLNFPEISLDEFKKKFQKGKYFYLKKRLSQSDKEKIWSLGEKGIIFEPFQSRIYTHGNLFSHVLGQVDYDNYGISGVERFFDKELKQKNMLNSPLELTLDTSIQYLITEEMNNAIDIFKATGGAALLMNVNTGEVLSLVSLPNFNINLRENITDNKYINKITKGVYELGSIFKTFTVALALDKNIATPETVIKNIPKKVKCSIHEISDIKQFPSELTVEDILVRSSNVGTLLLAKKIGKENYEEFLKSSGLLKPANFELEEIGRPLKFNWNKCKLETISYGHGIAITPLQALATYSAISNGGNIINPTIIKKNRNPLTKKIVSQNTSTKINSILRKVVTEKEGTASLADVYGFDVGGKTGTSQKYGNKNDSLNTFISVFPTKKPKYSLLVMLENPQVAHDITYNYRGMKVKGTRNEAGWNSVYTAGKIIKKIGPILAIKNEEFYNDYVAEKLN